MEYGKEKNDKPDCEKHPCNCETQSHTHEILGSVKLAEEGEERHNHRFATVSTEAIPLSCGSHKHAFCVNTDFYDHHHEIAGETSAAIYLFNGKHVHFATGQTTLDDGHYHNYQFATLIDSPLLPE